MRPPSGARAALPAQLEYAFVLSGLLVVAGVFNPVFNDFLGTRAASYTEANAARLAVNSAIYGIALALALLRWRRTSLVLAAHPLVIAAILLPLLSLIWSVDPDTTLRRASAHVLAGAFCIYLASTISLDDLFRRLTLTFLIGAILSLIYVALAPEAAIHAWGGLTGSWRGVYGHKNELGQAASIGVIVALLAVDRTRLDVCIRLAALGLSVALLVMSRSVTSLLVVVSLAVVIPTGFLLQNRQFSPGVRLLFLALLVLLGVGIASQWASLALEALGRDLSFSGRTTLWQGVSDVVADRFPVLGAGYGAFFTPSGGIDDLAPYLTHWGGVPNHAHSGFVDTRANLGWPGVVLLWGLILTSLYRVIDILIRRRAPRAWVGVLAFQVLFLINNFSESSAFRHTDLVWMLFLILACQGGPAQVPAPASVRRRRPSLSATARRPGSEAA